MKSCSNFGPGYEWFMAILRFLLWTFFCLGLGFFLATTDSAGSRLLRKGVHAVTGYAPRAVRYLTEERQEEAKPLPRGAKTETTKPMGPAPKERHDPADRAAIDKLIATPR